MHSTKCESLRVFKAHLSSLTRRHFSTSHQAHFGRFLDFWPEPSLVLWWSTLTMEMSTSDWPSANPKRCTWRKNTFGRFSSKQWRVSKCCMTSKFFTETWKARTCSCSRTVVPNLAISTFRKLQKTNSCTHRLVPLIMLHQRFGETSLMIWSPTSGRLDAWSTKCAHLYLLSELTIWTGCSRKLWRVFTQTFPVIFRWIWETWFRVCCSLCLHKGQTAEKFLRWKLSKNE